MIMRAPVLIRSVRDARLTLFAAGVVLAGQANAAGSGMPWEEPPQKVLESVQGPVAKIVAVIIIISTGLTLAFGGTAGGFKGSNQFLFRLDTALSASALLL